MDCETQSSTGHLCVPCEQHLHHWFSICQPIFLKQCNLPWKYDRYLDRWEDPGGKMAWHNGEQTTVLATGD